MKSNYKTLILMTIALSSCDKEKEISDIAILDNRTNKPAFSFSKGGAVSAIDAEADFILLDLLLEDGSPLGMYFSSSHFTDTSFSLLATYQSFDSAEVYFDSLSIVPDVRFYQMAMSILPNQIWAVISHDKKFGKILILEAAQYTHNETVYAKAKFRWSIQKNGTRSFDE